MNADWTSVFIISSIIWAVAAVKITRIIVTRGKDFP